MTTPPRYSVASLRQLAIGIFSRQPAWQPTTDGRQGSRPATWSASARTAWPLCPQYLEQIEKG